jgi:4-amino-4-deoxy-L-arabinose transferase-like glycosyltransferase
MPRKGKGTTGPTKATVKGLWYVPKGKNGRKDLEPKGFGLGSVAVRMGIMPKFPWLTRWQWALLATMVIAIFTRFVKLGDAPLFHDEAYYWVWEQHLGPGNLELSFYDHPPGIAYLIYISTAIFGDSEFGVRAIFAIIGVVNIWVLYKLGKYLYDERTGVIAAFLLSVNFGHILFSRSAMNDVAATLAFTVILFLFAKAVFERSDRYLILAGFALGVGFLIKYTIAVIALGFLVFAAVYPKYRKFIFGKTLVYSMSIAAVLTLPFWAWNATHDWAGFVYQGGHASPFLGLFFGGDFFANQIRILTSNPMIWFIAIGVPLTLLSLASLFWFFKFQWRKEAVALLGVSFLGMIITYAMQLLILTFAFELMFWAAVIMAYKGFKSEKDALVGLTALVFIAFFAMSLGNMPHWVFPAFAPISILGARWLPRAYKYVVLNKRQLFAFAAVAMFGLTWVTAYSVNGAYSMGNMSEGPDPKAPFGAAWTSTTYPTKMMGEETAHYCRMYPDAVVLVPNWVTYSPVDYYLYREGVDVDMYTWVWDYQIGIVWERDVEHMPNDTSRAVVPVYASSFLGGPDEDNIFRILVYSDVNESGWRWWGSNDQTMFARTGFDHYQIVSIGRLDYNYTIFYQETNTVVLPYFVVIAEKRGTDNVTVVDENGFEWWAPKSDLIYEGAQGKHWTEVFNWKYKSGTEGEGP